jgi:hypothetical protein
MATYKATIHRGAIGPFKTIATESPMETKEENALWAYNSARQHDGLPPLTTLPKGFKFEKVCSECYGKGVVNFQGAHVACPYCG